MRPWLYENILDLLQSNFLGFKFLDFLGLLRTPLFLDVEGLGDLVSCQVLDVLVKINLIDALVGGVDHSALKVMSDHLDYRSLLVSITVLSIRVEVDVVQEVDHLGVEANLKDWGCFKAEGHEVGLRVSVLNDMDHLFEAVFINQTQEVVIED